MSSIISLWELCYVFYKLPLLTAPGGKCAKCKNVQKFLEMLQPENEGLKKYDGKNRLMIKDPSMGK